MKRILTLQQLGEGMRARILALPSSDRHYRAQLIAMGLTIGAEILIKRIAALGGPIEIMVRGARMSLRRQETEELLLERIDV